MAPLGCGATQRFALPAGIASSPVKVGFAPASCSHIAWRCSRSMGRRMDARLHAAQQAQPEKVWEDSPGCEDREGGHRDHVDPSLAPLFGLCLSRMDGFGTKPAFSAFRSLRWWLWMAFSRNKRAKHQQSELWRPHGADLATRRSHPIIPTTFFQERMIIASAIIAAEGNQD